MTGKKSGVPDGEGGDPIPEQGFDRWLNRQLHKLYDPVLAEQVPDEIMRLLQEFDDRSAGPVTGAADPPAGTRAATPGKPDSS